MTGATADLGPGSLHNEKVNGYDGWSFSCETGLSCGCMISFGFSTGFGRRVFGSFYSLGRGALPRSKD